jgi:hypothetical protein
MKKNIEDRIPSYVKTIFVIFFIIVMSLVIVFALFKGSIDNAFVSMKGKEITLYVSGSIAAFIIVFWTIIKGYKSIITLLLSLIGLIFILNSIFLPFNKKSDENVHCLIEQYKLTSDSIEYLQKRIIIICDSINQSNSKLQFFENPYNKAGIEKDPAELDYFINQYKDLNNKRELQLKSIDSAIFINN